MGCGESKNTEAPLPSVATAVQEHHTKVIQKAFDMTSVEENAALKRGVPKMKLSDVTLQAEVIRQRLSFSVSKSFPTPNDSHDHSGAGSAPRSLEQSTIPEELVCAQQRSHFDTTHMAGITMALVEELTGEILHSAVHSAKPVLRQDGNDSLTLYDALSTNPLRVDEPHSDEDNEDAGEESKKDYSDSQSDAHRDCISFALDCDVGPTAKDGSMLVIEIPPEKHKEEEKETTEKEEEEKKPLYQQGLSPLTLSEPFEDHSSTSIHSAPTSMPSSPTLHKNISALGRPPSSPIRPPRNSFPVTAHIHIDSSQKPPPSLNFHVNYYFEAQKSSASSVHSAASEGHGSSIGDMSSMSHRNSMTIGKNVSFSEEVQICTIPETLPDEGGEHPDTIPVDSEPKEESGRTVVEW